MLIFMMHLLNCFMLVWTNWFSETNLQKPLQIYKSIWVKTNIIKTHLSKTFYFENESGNIIRFLFIDEKKAWQRKIARWWKIAGNSFAMAAKITTPHSLRSLVRQVIFAFAIAQNFLPAIFHRRVVFKRKN